MGFKFITLILLSVLAGCTSAPSSVTLIAPEDVATSDVEDPVLRQGQVDYNTYCGHCHGYNGEGQGGNALETALQQGMRPVPPHNADGSTWRYADQLLLRVVKEGVLNPLDQFPMPGFAAALNDERIMGILAYMKLWWTDEQRNHQAEVTAQLQRVWDVLGVDEITLTPVS